MKKIRILFVAEELAVNGAMVSLMRLLAALPRERYDISLFVFHHGGPLTKDIPADIKVLPESLPYKIHRMPMKDAIKLSLKKCRPDLALFRSLVSVQRGFNLDFKLWPFLPRIEGVYDVAISYTDGFTAPMILRKTNARKKACWIHFTYSDWQQPKFVYNALQKADCCVPVSNEAGNDLDLVLHNNIKKFIVHNIIDVQECNEKAKESCELTKTSGIFRIVSVGRVTRQKAMDLYPQTARILKDRGLSFEWYVVGGGGISQDLIKECRIRGVADCLHFIGARQNCMPWIKSADVFVNPSRYEAWGMTVSEALCLGKAVIASNIPVFHEQVQDGFNGILCNIDPSAIADAICQVQTDYELKEKLEANAVKYPFTKEYIINEFNRMIDGLLND